MLAGHLSLTFMSIPLYDYQSKTVSLLREKITQGKKRIVIVLPTGSGKTNIAAHIIHSAKNKSKKVIFLAHRQELVYQAHERLARFGVDAGIIMAGHPVTDPEINVASVQTLIRRQHPPADIIFIDECHHTNSQSYTKIIKNYPDAYVFGLTATPYRSDGKPLGEIFQDIITPISIQELIDQNFLVRPRYFGAKQDFSDVKIKMGDYDNKELFEKVDKKILYDGVVEKFKQFGYGKTLVFCVNVQHSIKTCAVFTDAGYAAAHLDADTDTQTRKRILKEFADGKWQILCNVALFTEGFDLPAINTIILNRATKSKGLYCLDEQTEILTEEGWKKDISIGDNYVAAMIPETGEIKFVPPLSIIRRELEHDESWISIQSPCLDVKVTNKHKMLYRQRRDKRIGWSFKTAEELAKLSSGINLPISGHQCTDGIPLSDDELRFIGWVMTDGTINKYNNAITITQGTHQPWLEEIQRVIDACGFKHNRFIRNRNTKFNESSPATWWTISKGDPRLRDKHLRGWKHLEQWISKDLSPMLMDMSVKQFEVFIHALHLGDGAKQLGYTWTRRSYHISGSNLVMMERLQILAITRGWKANISEHRGNKNLLYIIHLKQKLFASAASTHDIRPTWKTTPSVFGEKCWCVENEIGTLVTRRNGKVVIVGNCQIVGRGLRTAEGKDTCIIIDHGNNVYEHGTVEAEQEYDIHAKKKKKKSNTDVVDQVKQCPKCQSLVGKRTQICYHCGFEFPAIHEVVEAEFEEIRIKKVVIPSHLKKPWSKMTDEELEEYRLLKGYKRGWCHYQRKLRIDKEKGCSCHISEPCSYCINKSMSEENEMNEKRDAVATLETPADTLTELKDYFGSKLFEKDTIYA